jgi:hypothetical protein
VPRSRKKGGTDFECPRSCGTFKSAIFSAAFCIAKVLPGGLPLPRLRVKRGGAEQAIPLPRYNTRFHYRGKELTEHINQRKSNAKSCERVGGKSDVVSCKFAWHFSRFLAPVH